MKPKRMKPAERDQLRADLAKFQVIQDEREKLYAKIQDTLEQVEDERDDEIRAAQDARLERHKALAERDELRAKLKAVCDGVESAAVDSLVRDSEADRAYQAIEESHQRYEHKLAIAVKALEIIQHWVDTPQWARDEARRALAEIGEKS